MRKVAFWTASGGRYIEEAQKSAETFRAHMPDIPRVLITEVNCGVAGFDDVTVMARSDLQHWYLRSIEYYQYAITQLPYDLFLAFDTDTHICAPLYDLYEVLERFDFVGCHAPRRDPFPVDTPVPAAFSTINVGVLGFRKSEATKRLLEDWLKIAERHYSEYQELGYAFFTDQVPLREALWSQSGLQIWIAPPEYNCRFNFGVFVDGMVKVLHGRSDDIRQVARSINATEEPRLWKNGTIHP